MKQTYLIAVSTEVKRQSRKYKIPVNKVFKSKKHYNRRDYKCSSLLWKMYKYQE